MVLGVRKPGVDETNFRHVHCGQSSITPVQNPKILTFMIQTEVAILEFKRTFVEIELSTPLFSLRKSIHVMVSKLKYKSNARRRKMH